MIGEPPSFVGAVHVNETCVLPAVPDTDVGAPGVVTGVTPDETIDVAPVPAALIALTRNVYAVPFTKLVTVCEAVADATRPVTVTQSVSFIERSTR